LSFDGTRDVNSLTIMDLQSVRFRNDCKMQAEKERYLQQFFDMGLKNETTDSRPSKQH